MCQLWALHVVTKRQFFTFIVQSGQYQTSCIAVLSSTQLCSRLIRRSCLPVNWPAARIRGSERCHLPTLAWTWIIYLAVYVRRPTLFRRCQLLLSAAITTADVVADWRYGMMLCIRYDTIYVHSSKADEMASLL